MLEKERLATLRSYRILDTLPEPAFDALAQEIALLADGDRQRRDAAASGSPSRRCARACRRVLLA